MLVRCPAGGRLLMERALETVLEVGQGPFVGVACGFGEPVDICVDVGQDCAWDRGRDPGFFRIEEDAQSPDRPTLGEAGISEQGVETTGRDLVRIHSTVPL